MKTGTNKTKISLKAISETWTTVNTVFNCITSSAKRCRSKKCTHTNTHIVSIPLCPWEGPRLGNHIHSFVHTYGWNTFAPSLRSSYCMSADKSSGQRGKKEKRHREWIWSLNKDFFPSKHTFIWAGCTRSCIFSAANFYHCAFLVNLSEIDHLYSHISPQTRQIREFWIFVSADFLFPRPRV